MAVQIIENRTCDGLKLGSEPGDFVVRHDPPVKALARVFALDGQKAKAVDLCDPCNSGPTCLTLDELRAVLSEFGVAIEAGKNVKPTPVAERRPGSMQREKTNCIWCPNEYTWASWSGHLKSAHGFAGVKDALGTICPACGAEHDGLSVHITRGHDEFPVVTDAFFWARDNNDPFGVWAKVYAAGQNVIPVGATLL